MRKFAEVILSDDRVATMRGILTGDWLLMLRTPGVDSEIALMLSITEIDDIPLTYESIESLPIEDFMLLKYLIGKELERISSCVPTLKGS